jgi:hypothetical protein
MWRKIRRNQKANAQWDRMLRGVSGHPTEVRRNPLMCKTVLCSEFYAG